MAVELSEMSEAELRAEVTRLGGCLYRAEDTLSQMLLLGKLKRLHREILRDRTQDNPKSPTPKREGGGG